MVYNTLNHWICGLCPSVIEVSPFQGAQREGVSLPSSEDGNKSSFRNVAFSSSLKILTMNEVYKPSDFI
jgi:hypothetical protein